MEENNKMDISCCGFFKMVVLVGVVMVMFLGLGKVFVLEVK